MNMTKAFIMGLLAVVLAAFASTDVLANPYDGVNRIGTYYQNTNTYHYNYNVAGFQNQYIAPPRAGGWFGSGSEWLVGLRAPVYAPMPIQNYPQYYAPVYNNAYYMNGYQGYPRLRASDFSYRDRIGGMYGY